MTLIIESTQHQCEKSEVPAYVDRICSMPSVKLAASNFRERVHQFSSPHNLLYVHQGEMATVPCDLESKGLPSVMASDDATSCLILVLRFPRSCTLVHLDHRDRVSDFFTQIEQYFIPRGTCVVDAHIIGGFTDDGHLSRGVLDLVMSEMLCGNSLYTLKTFCVADLNTTVELNSQASCRHQALRRPIIMGMAFNWQTNTAIAATLSWSARGPLPALRLARLQTGEVRVVNVFDPNSCELIIMPFGCDWRFRDPKVLKRSDLAKLSTTPEQEPQTFFEGLYSALNLLFRCPNLLDYWFAEGALRFACSDSQSLDENPNASASEITWRPANEAAARAVQDNLASISQIV